MTVRAAALSLSLLVACAGDPEPVPNLPTSGDTYVISSFDIPETAGQAGDVAVDVDGDGRPENSLMQFFPLVFSRSERVPEEEINASVTRGDTLQLLLIGPTDVDGVDGVRVFLGADTDDDPTNNLDGTAELRVRPRSVRIFGSFGAIRGSNFEFSGGDFVLENDLFGRLEIELSNASIVGRVAGDGTISGRLGGGIPLRYVDSVLAPAVRDTIVSEVSRDCPGTEYPECCLAGSDGEGWLEFFATFDESPDCVLSPDEVESSTGFLAAFAPDVDIVGGDGIDDALSFGVGFTAVPATFAVP